MPPYIRRSDEPSDRERYQTVFATRPAAVAAPTAGLHFTQQTLAQIRARGAEICEITLEVGLGTFQPVHGEDLDQHVMHTEAYEISPEAAEAIATGASRRAADPGRGNDGRSRAGRRRAESRGRAARRRTNLRPAAPPPTSSFVRATASRWWINSLPISTCRARRCWCWWRRLPGGKPILSAYRHAVAAGYRFYSYGDCMLIR